MALNEKASSELLAGRLLDLVEPKDVFSVAGEWIAYRLHDEGFRWIKRQAVLRRRDSGRTENIYLERSHWNRAGRLIEFSVVKLDVFDEKLEAWRRAHPELTVERPPSIAAILAATSFLDISRESRAIITHPIERLILQQEIRSELL